MWGRFLTCGGFVSRLGRPPDNSPATARSRSKHVAPRRYRYLLSAPPSEARPDYRPTLAVSIDTDPPSIPSTGNVTFSPACCVASTYSSGR
jgi:hypothetical protein